MPLLIEPVAARWAPTARAIVAEAPSDFPHFSNLIPPGMVHAGAYVLQFATTRQDFDAVQRLRYRSYHELLGASAANPGRRLDADAHDPWFHHLIVRSQASGEVHEPYFGTVARLVSYTLSLRLHVLHRVGSLRHRSQGVRLRRAVQHVLATKASKRGRQYPEKQP